MLSYIYRSLMTPPASKPGGLRFHNLRHHQQHPHLSSTSLRNLVKHFITSPSKHPMNPPDLSPSPTPNSSKQSSVLDPSQAQISTHRQPHKRQVRRRLHTTRPYHDRLLNMAEARKEIVTALKFHRASLKQQQAKQQHHPCSDQDGGTVIMSPTNPPISPSCTDNSSHLLDDFSLSPLSHPPLSLPNPLNWPSASSVAQPHTAQNLSYNLPNRTLGLNLNFQNFDNLDAALYLDHNNASFYSYSSPSSSSPSLSLSKDQDIPSVPISQGEGTSAPADAIDSIAAAQVALWPTFVRNMEHQATEDDAAYTIFDGPMEFPDWLNANERCFEQCSQEYVLDPTLPCMDIGDFQGMGEEWLA